MKTVLLHVEVEDFYDFIEAKAREAGLLLDNEFALGISNLSDEFDDFYIYEVTVDADEAQTITEFPDAAA